MRPRPSPLEKLLELRRGEEKQAKQTLQTALADQVSAADQLEAARALVMERRAALVAFMQENEARRASGFTIAQRLMDADGERAFRTDVGEAETVEADAVAAYGSASEAVEEARRAYVSAQRAAELVARRVAAGEAEVQAKRQRREDADALDVVLTRDYQARRDEERGGQ